MIVASLVVSVPRLGTSWHLEVPAVGAAPSPAFRQERIAELGVPCGIRSLPVTGNAACLCHLDLS
jgi:hypothetical protein